MVSSDKNDVSEQVDSSEKKDTLSKIRSKSIEDFLENKLTTVYFQKGYSKSSVKEYVNHLLKEIYYQKENFKDRIKEVLDEKERLLNEKNLLVNQLTETSESLGKYEKEGSKISDFQEIIESLNEELNAIKNENEKLKLCDNDERNVKIDELSEKLAFYENENKTLIDKLNEINEKFYDIQDENTFNGDLVLKNVELQKVLENLKSQHVEYDKVKAHNQELAQEVLALNKMNGELSVIEKEQELKIINLETQLSEQKVKYYDDLKKISEEFELERAHYEKLVQDYKAEAEAEVEKRVILTKERDRLKHRVDEYLKCFDELCNNINSVDSLNINS